MEARCSPMIVQPRPERSYQNRINFATQVSLLSSHFCVQRKAGIFSDFRQDRRNATLVSIHLMQAR